MMSLQRLSLTLLLITLLPSILPSISQPISLSLVSALHNPPNPSANEGRRRHHTKRRSGDIVEKKDGSGKCRLKQWKVGDDDDRSIMSIDASTTTTTTTSMVEPTTTTTSGVQEQFVDATSLGFSSSTTSSITLSDFQAVGTSTSSISSISQPSIAVQILTHSSSSSSSSSSIITTTNSIQSTNNNNNKKVFAHFMVGVVSTYLLQDWKDDMELAMSYWIDGFALNIGTDIYTENQLGLAYQAAESVGFLVFISFDFNWFSISLTQPVINIILQFCNLPGQFIVIDPTTSQSSAYISTFSGDGFNWAAVKKSVGMDLFVVPNWQATEENANTEGVDGLYSWYAWPSENNRPIDQSMSTVHDEAYLAVTAPVNKLYMTPVSPWFSTHFGEEVSYSKNWLFKSETLWYDRWQQILAMQDQIQFLEIVTWNDYGESHYVGPFDTPHSDDGSSRWAAGMPHDALLEFAKPYISAFKNGAQAPVIDQDMLIYWYRPHMKDANCDSTDNCGSKPDGWDLVSDSVFIAAFTKSTGTVTVTSGSNSAITNNVQAGVTMLEVPMVPGSQQFSMTTEDGVNLSQTSVLQVSAGCWNGTIYNFNVYSGIISG